MRKRDSRGKVSVMPAVHIMAGKMRRERRGGGTIRLLLDNHRRRHIESAWIATTSGISNKNARVLNVKSAGKANNLPNDVFFYNFR
jgi:hypothetical protein